MRAIIYFLLRRRPSIRVMCCDCAHHIRQFSTEPHVSLCGVVPRPSFILGSWVERVAKEREYLRTRHFCSMANPRGFCLYFKPKPLLRYEFCCNNGHHWLAPKAVEDTDAGYKCPTCGERWTTHAPAA